jgi:serine/threonine protein kinase
MEIHATSCLDESTVLGLIDGQLGTDEAARAEAHLADCRDCRELVSELARSSAGTSSTMPAQPGGDPYSEGIVLGGRFRLLRKLGEGGMGVVWAATHLVTRKDVALKIARGLPSERERHRFLREARVASALDHPGIVPVRDAFELDDGTPVLVMDLLIGRSLRDHLRERGPLPVGELVPLARPLLEALGAAHARGVVHRDLKPENVFLADDGDARVLKVLDFGVAKLVTTDEVTGQTTRSGEILGTPFYMAPEQAFGEKVDHRADLWAVGVMLYECLTGTRPFHGDNLGQLLKAVTQGEHVPIAQARPELPRHLTALVESLLRTERERRPASTAEVLVALDGQRLPDTRLAWWIGFSLTLVFALGGGVAYWLTHRPAELAPITAPILMPAELPAPQPSAPAPAAASQPSVPTATMHAGKKAVTKPPAAAKPEGQRLPGGVVGEVPY